MGVGKWLNGLVVATVAATAISAGANAVPLVTGNSLQVGQFLFTITGCTASTTAGTITSSAGSTCAAGTTSELIASGTNGFTIDGNNGTTGPLQTATGTGANVDIDTKITVMVQALGSAGIYATTISQIASVVGTGGVNVNTASAQIRDGSNLAIGKTETVVAGSSGSPSTLLLGATYQAIYLVFDIATQVVGGAGSFTVTTQSVTQTVTVPEPASALLLVSAVGALAGLRRRKTHTV